MQKIYFVFLFLLALSWAQAQSHQQSISAVDDSQYADYDRVTLFDSTSVVMEESGLSHVYGHCLYKVLTPAGH